MDRENRWYERGLKEAIYVKRENVYPTLPRQSYLDSCSQDLVKQDRQKPLTTHRSDGRVRDLQECLNLKLSTFTFKNNIKEASCLDSSLWEFLWCLKFPSSRLWYIFPHYQLIQLSFCLCSDLVTTPKDRTEPKQPQSTMLPHSTSVYFILGSEGGFKTSLEKRLRDVVQYLVLSIKGWDENFHFLVDNFQVVVNCEDVRVASEKHWGNPMFS